jgi:hypothetical protein
MCRKAGGSKKGHFEPVAGHTTRKTRKTRTNINKIRRARRKSGGWPVKQVPTPLLSKADKGLTDYFGLKNTHFGLSAQIFDSKGIHLFHRCCRQALWPLSRRLPKPKSETSIGVMMNTKLIAAVLVAASATIAAPAFASGYGPAPFYRPGVGAPASQQGQSAQTVAAERAAADNNTAYGGVKAASTQSGARQQYNAQ